MPATGIEHDRRALLDIDDGLNRAGVGRVTVMGAAVKGIGDRHRPEGAVRIGGGLPFRRRGHGGKDAMNCSGFAQKNAQKFRFVGKVVSLPFLYCVAFIRCFW